MLTKSALVCILLLVTVQPLSAQKTANRRTATKTATAKTAIPGDLMLRFLKLEDERHLNDEELLKLLFHSNAAVRERAALALGRIGDKRATSALLTSVEKDQEANVRAMAAFALGEIEDNRAIDELLRVLANNTEALSVRARASEAIGKIASLPANAELLKAELERINRALIQQLPDPQAKLSAEQKLMTLLTVNALMRVRNAASVIPLAQQLKSTDADVRAQTANALFRLRLPLAEAMPALLEALTDKDANVRANAVRALGQSRDLKDINLVRRMYQLVSDPNDQVRTNALRGLSTLATSGHQLAVEMLVIWSRGQIKTLTPPRQPLSAELEVVATLGILKEKRALEFLKALRAASKQQRYPEIESAIARIDDKTFLNGLPDVAALKADQWKQVTAIAVGLGEINSPQSQAKLADLLKLCEEAKLDLRAMPAVLRALAKHKPDNFSATLRDKLRHNDLFIRATAADLLSDSISEENLAALIAAFAQSKSDVQTDAKLSLLNAIAKYKDDKAREAMRSALDDENYLVRRRAAELLKQELKNAAVVTRHDDAFYQRVLRRLGTKPTAIIQTKRGRITLELFADDAPLTVENFTSLARSGFFNGVTFHRVVPNFVIQGGDPRGDGSGGPDHQIRCEINLKPYTRGALGMALSGKDTGGSQWFITHSPQPHLDGGYTVFGKVIAGLEIVDQIARGDVIEKITVLDKRR